MIKRQTIILLVGPKGAGKTYLASRMESEHGIAFIRVEPIWLALTKEISPGSASFDEEGQARVLSAVRTALEASPAVVLESTGTAPWFGCQLARLRSIGDVVLVKVEAPLPACMKRIHERDASLHIPVSDDRIDEINAIAAKVELPWTMTVQNLDAEHADEFLRSISQDLGLGV